MLELPMYKIIIIGAGAAGLFLAANLEKISQGEAILLEGSHSLGNKLLLSGGGMCNLTNRDETEEFITHFGDIAKSQFLKPSLKNFSTRDLYQWFQRRGLPLIEREDGKVFPQSLKAQSVVDLLRAEATQNKVDILKDSNVLAIKKIPKGFAVKTLQQNYETQKVVLATGGKSYPITGSDGSGYTLAASLGHKIIEPTQALTGVKIRDYPFTDLAGCSLKNISIDFFRENQEKRFLNCRGDLLFTHQGISGPVILNNSRKITPGDILKASLIPNEKKEDSRSHLNSLLSQGGKKSIKKVLTQLGLFKTLADKILEINQLNSESITSELSRKTRQRMINHLVDYPFIVQSKGSFASAMATAGGIHIKEINRLTMESRIQKGLYFAGEIIDIDGDTGGYNIQAAFSTAYQIAKQFKA